MGKWSGGGCLGNLSVIDLKSNHGHENPVMPSLGTNLSTRYHKLDDSVFLLCQHCGHSFKTDELRKMATYRGPTPTTRLRSNSKHFLTWSATAANHKLQKLSKHFANNVSKLQSKFPFHHPSKNPPNPSDPDPDDSSDWEPPCMANGLGRRRNLLNNDGTNIGNSSSSANLVENDSLLMNNIQNNNSVSVCPSPVEGTLTTTSTALAVNVSVVNGRKYGASHGQENLNRSSQSEICYTTENDLDLSPYYSRQNLSEKSRLIVKGMIGVQVTSTFESGAVAEGHIRKLNGSRRSRSNNSSLSTSGSGGAGSSVILPSSHWSRASTISATTGLPTNNSISQLPCASLVDGDGGEVNVDAGSHQNHHPHHRSNHLLLGAEDDDDEEPPQPRTRNWKNNKQSFSLGGIFSSRSSTGSNNSGSGRSSSPADDGRPIASSSPKLSVTIFEDDVELRHVPWFQAGIPREIALEVLRNEPIGSFIVRESTTKSGCFALSMRVPREFHPKGIAHYLILRTGRGFKIKGFTKEFQSLVSLITHHSVMPELLPCPLSLHRYRPKYTRRRLHSSDFMEPEKLIPFRKFTDF